MADAFEEILSHLGTFLRYIAPGFVALAVVLAVMQCSRAIIHNYPEWVIIAGAALAGVIIYSMHTGSIVRLWAIIIIFLHVKWPRSGSFSKNSKKLQGKSLSRLMFDLDTERWKRRASKDRVAKQIQKEMDTWANMLNFLYCSSYYVAVIPLCLRWLQPALTQPYWGYVSILGVVMFFSALYSSYRIINREFWALKK